MVNQARDPLKESLFRVVRGQVEKTCPECSRRAGRAVYHRVDDFGYRDTGAAEAQVQPWCKKCRTMASLASRAARRA